MQAVGFEWIPSFSSSRIDADRIYPGLYQGSVPPAGPHVARAGFDLVVLAATRAEYRYFYGQEPDAHLFPGAHVHVADLDDADLTQEELTRARSAARAVARVLRNRGTVLCSCMQGRNRSGLISALSIHSLTKASGRACVQQIQRSRPGALMNQSFVRYLNSLT